MNLFCLYHIEHFFIYHDPQTSRLDISLKKYFKLHKALGSKDRKNIANFVFLVSRFFSLLRYTLKIDKIDVQTIPKILALDIKKFFQEQKVPKHILYGFDEDFFRLLSTSLPAENFEKFLSSLNEEAPLFGRVNPLKTSREKLIEELSPLTEVKKTAHSPYGLQFGKRENFFHFSAFKDGKFEIQDESSQLVALKLGAKPKERILDFCAGSGGKSLCIGAEMQNTGQLYLHDVREAPLIEAKKRLRRAGVQNIQILPHGPICKKYNRYFDRLLLDVPCTGTGTLRRNPDRKERLTVQDVEELVALQRTIFDEAIAHVKPGGKILWATCSVLKEENQDQIAFFCENYPVKMIGEPLAIFPISGESDGFFAQMLEFTPL
ncbi:MAG: RsmB/NOP family class I SAM-dependent RNA methyltransferase [Chlamydiia bacterium]